MDGVQTKTGNGNADLPEFPGETPTEKQLQDWVDIADPIVQKTYGSLLRGDVPPDLAGTKNAADADLSGYTVLAAPTAPASGDAAAIATHNINASKIMEHNRRVQQATASKASATAAYASAIEERSGNLALALKQSMLSSAPNKLADMQAKHKVRENLHNGCAMYKDLLALKGHTGVHEEILDHDREVETIRDTKLPDHCAVQDYSDLINRVKEHLPHMSRPFPSPADLSKFYIKLMPMYNAGEGRQLLRRLSAEDDPANSGKKKIENVSLVIGECTMIVNESTSPANRVAAAAVPVHAASRHDKVAAIVQAAMPYH